MAKAPPAFQFYPADFLVGTIHLTAEETGVYIKLLCSQWAHQRLPSDEKTLARFACVLLADFQRIWPSIADKFDVVDDRFLVNCRLESIRSEQAELRLKRQKAGAKGGKKAVSKRGSKTSRKNQAKEDRRLKTEDSSKKLGECSETESVFEHYRTHHLRAKLDDKSEKLIGDRLSDGFSVADLKKAIDGNHRSPHHCGQNDTATKYHKLSLIMRDADQVNAFIEHADRPAVVLSPKNQRNMQTGATLLNTSEDF